MSEFSSADYDDAWTMLVAATSDQRNSFLSPELAARDHLRWMLSARHRVGPTDPIRAEIAWAIRTAIGMRRMVERAYRYEGVPDDVRATIKRMVAHITRGNESSPVFHELHAVAAWLEVSK